MITQAFRDSLIPEIYHIERISHWGYLFAIIFGKNREAEGINFERGGDTPIDRYLDGNFIVTITNSILIVTDMVNGKRVPIIVKKWVKKSEQHQDVYTDVDGNQWLYFRNRNTLKVDLNGIKLFIPFKD